MPLQTGHRSSTPTEPPRHITSEPASGAVYTSAETPPRKLAEAAERAAAASPTEQISVNITDPESRIMKTQTG